MHGAGRVNGNGALGITNDEKWQTLTWNGLINTT